MPPTIVKDLLGFQYIVLRTTDGMVSMSRVRDAGEGKVETDPDWCGPLFDADQWDDVLNATQKGSEGS